MKVLSDQVVQTTFRSCSLMVLKHFGFGLVFILHYRFVSCSCAVFKRACRCVRAGIDVRSGSLPWTNTAANLGVAALLIDAAVVLGPKAIGQNIAASHG